MNNSKDFSDSKRREKRNEKDQRIQILNLTARCFPVSLFFCLERRVIS